ncbi:MAG TPA: hypothetical protein PL151_16870 [Phycisphaerae bacterium]|nr:hypothetical protein [Phycisphaerae bacterium]HOJ73192.1 hypothetical protein [Phycisphaerae bacterium]HOM52155.1 hypothetical protein [Phycisphaerae bacterium]HON68234.1 hypothetical protein [Phycisphaerae bacterium]HPP25370.1 hypothetical protein [Phycisphaerae bacterium]
MVIVLGALLALLAAWGAKTKYVGKLESLDEEIARLEKKQDEILAERKRLMRGKEAWLEAGRQTLGTDDAMVQTLFRPDIDALVQEVGLANGSVTLKGTPKVGKNGLRSLTCTVTAEGKLDQILKYLFKVHQRPYIVRCRRITLAQQTGKNVPKNTLKMTVEMDTLLLPDAKAEGLPRVQPVDLTSQPAVTIVRTKKDKFEDYEDIIERKIFEPWTPPVPLPGKVVGHQPGPNGRLAVTAQQLRWNAAPNAKTYEVFVGEENPPPSMSQGVSGPASGQVTFQIPRALTLGKTYYWRVDSINSEGKRTEGDVLQFTVYQPETPVVVAPPPPPQPPPDANLVLARIISSPTRQQVVLENPANKAEEDKRVEIGDTLYGGTLIFVHPKGAVSTKDDKLYYHPLTKALRECVPLTEESQPELLYEYLKLEQRAAGISERPG